MLLIFIQIIGRLIDSLCRLNDLVNTGDGIAVLEQGLALGGGSL